MVWGSSPRIPSVLAQQSEVMRQGDITYQWGSTAKRGTGTTHVWLTLRRRQHNPIYKASATTLFAESVH